MTGLIEREHVLKGRWRGSIFPLAHVQYPVNAVQVIMFCRVSQEKKIVGVAIYFS
jgi:hypothetical protein